MEPQRRSAVEQHVSWFANKNGELTDESMAEGHTNQGIYCGWLQHKVNIYPKVSVLNDLMAKNCEEHDKHKHLPKCIATVFNEASSGLWDKDGNFSEERFAELKTRSIKNLEGKDSVTALILNQFANDWRGDKKHETADHFFGLSVTWDVITKGSLGELVKFYSDGQCTNKDGKLENSITLDRVEQFYRDPISVMQEKKDEFDKSRNG